MKRDRNWLGFEGGDMVATIDLGETKQVRQIGVDCLQNQVSWIFYPKTVEFEISLDGASWESIGTTTIPIEPAGRPAIRLVTQDIPPTPVRFVRIRAANVGQCPDWHPGAGGDAWVFVDEVLFH